MNLIIKKLGMFLIGACIASTATISTVQAAGIGPVLTYDAVLDRTHGLSYDSPVNIARSIDGQPSAVALFKFSTSGVDLSALTSLTLTVYGYPDYFEGSASSELKSYGVSDDWSTFTIDNINLKHEATLASNQVSAVSASLNKYTFDLLDSSNLSYLISSISDGYLSFAIQEVTNSGTIRTNIYSDNSAAEAQYMPQLVATYKEVPPTTPEPSSLILGMMGIIGSMFGIRIRK